MVNTIILVILFIFSILFLFFVRKKGRSSEIISFIATLIATLIGVLLAVTLSNLESQRKERADTAKLLHSASRIVEGTFEYVERIEETIKQFEQDTVTYSASLVDNLKKEPLPYPDLMENIIASELLSKNVTEYTHSMIYNVLINLRKLNNFPAIQQYKRFLQDLLLLLKLEAQFQEGDLSQKKISDEFKRESKLLDEKYPLSARG